MNNGVFCKAVSKQTNEWVYGKYYKVSDMHVIVILEEGGIFKDGIIKAIIEVFPNTVCRKTFLKDSTKRDVYEHDILRFKANNSDTEFIGYCRFSDDFGNVFILSKLGEVLPMDISESTITGNIYDYTTKLKIKDTAKSEESEECDVYKAVRKYGGFVEGKYYKTPSNGHFIEDNETGDIIPIVPETLCKVYNYVRVNGNDFERENKKEKSNNSYTNYEKFLEVLDAAKRFLEKRNDMYNKGILDYIKLNVFAIEEMSKLIKELTKDLRYKGNINNITEEIADVLNTILYILLDNKNIDIAKILDIMRDKTERAINRLKYGEQ